MRVLLQGAQPSLCFGPDWRAALCHPPSVLQILSTGRACRSDACLLQRHRATSKPGLMPVLDAMALCCKSPALLLQASGSAPRPGSLCAPAAQPARPGGRRTRPPRARPHTRAGSARPPAAPPPRRPEQVALASRSPAHANRQQACCVTGAAADQPGAEGWPSHTLLEGPQHNGAGTQRVTHLLREHHVRHHARGHAARVVPRRQRAKRRPRHRQRRAPRRCPHAAGPLLQARHRGRNARR